MFHCFNKVYIDFDFNLGLTAGDHILISPMVGDGVFPESKGSLIEARRTLDDFLFEKYIKKSNNQNILKLDALETYQAQSLEPEQQKEFLNLMWQDFFKYQSSLIIYLEPALYQRFYIDFMLRANIAPGWVKQLLELQVAKHKVLFPFINKNEVSRFTEYTTITPLPEEEINQIIYDHEDKFSGDILNDLCIELKLMMFLEKPHALDQFKFRSEITSLVYRAIDGELKDVRSSIIQDFKALNKLLEGCDIAPDWFKSGKSLFELIPNEYSFFFQNEIRIEYMNQSERKTLSQIIDRYLDHTKEGNYLLEIIRDNAYSELTLEKIFKIDRNYPLGSVFFGKGPTINYINNLLINELYRHDGNAHYFNS